MINILVTDAVSFEGLHICKKLLKDGFCVVGLDEIDDGKEAVCAIKKLRLDILKKNKNFRFVNVNINNQKKLKAIFDVFDFSIVIKLFVGIRRLNPGIQGFVNILEQCKNYKVRRTIFLYSNVQSSPNIKSLIDDMNCSMKIFGAISKSFELIAHSYSLCYGLDIIGLQMPKIHGTSEDICDEFVYVDDVINILSNVL